MTSTTCRMCGKHCKDERTLMKHAWDHSKEKNHSCTKCGKTFHNKARLKRHMQSHRNKSVSCNVCGESFPDGRSLMNHRHSHSNLSGRQFPCRECGKTFGSRSSQQIHMRIHTGKLNLIGIFFASILLNAFYHLFDFLFSLLIYISVNVCLSFKVYHFNENRFLINFFFEFHFR